MPAANNAYMSIADNKPTHKANAHPLRHICVDVSANERKTKKPNQKRFDYSKKIDY